MTQPPSNRFSQTPEGIHHPLNVKVFSHYKRGVPIKTVTTKQSWSGIQYKIYHRNIKYPRLEFKTGTLQLILPFGKNPQELLHKHKIWIHNKQKFIIDCLKKTDKHKIVSRNKNNFENLVHYLVKGNSKILKVKINNLFFRKMRTKWASCSSKRNLTINTLMQSLPKKQIEYIIYHELTHVYEKRHNAIFWRLISKRFKYHEQIESSLFPYWFLINKIAINKRTEL